jgi:hypothetical protein
MWKHKDNMDANVNNNNANDKTYIPIADLNETLFTDVEWIDTSFGYFPYYKMVIDGKPYYVFSYNDITLKTNGEAIRIYGVAKPLDSIN